MPSQKPTNISHLFLWNPLQVSNLTLQWVLLNGQIKLGYGRLGQVRSGQVRLQLFHFVCLYLFQIASPSSMEVDSSDVDTQRRQIGNDNSSNKIDNSSNKNDHSSNKNDHSSNRKFEHQNNVDDDHSLSRAVVSATHGASFCSMM